MNLLDQKQSAIEQHSRQAEEFARRYRDMEEDPYRNSFTYSRRRLDLWLDRLLPPSGTGLRLLDVGCGTGHPLAEMRRRGFEVSGVDGSADMLEQARALNPGAELLQTDVESLPFSDGRFDVVVCVEVLRYLPNPLPCLREMARVLRPGGVCLVTATPRFNLNGYWLVNRLANLMPIGDLVRLKQFFTTSGGLRRDLARAGFRTAEVHGVYLGPTNWVQRLCPRALPALLRRWEGIDAACTDRWPLREFSNMFLAVAHR